jgi:hypothetical protein
MLLSSPTPPPPSGAAVTYARKAPVDVGVWSCCRWSVFESVLVSGSAHACVFGVVWRASVVGLVLGGN